MSLFISKVLPLFLYPVGATISLLLLAGLLRLLRMKKLSVLSSILALIVIWVSSTPIVAWKLLEGLESQYPPPNVALIPDNGCALILGGTVAEADTPVTGINMHGSIDRVHVAARLYKSGKASNVIVAAGNLPWSGNSVAEADLISELLYEWGVPLNRIWIDRQSANTYQNAVNSKSLLSQASCDFALLVTSGFHMPRAMATFAKAEVSTYAIPIDVVLAENSAINLFSFLPTVEALETSTLVIKEHIGYWYYKSKGWI